MKVVHLEKYTYIYKGDRPIKNGDDAQSRLLWVIPLNRKITDFNVQIFKAHIKKRNIYKENKKITDVITELRNNDNKI